jgi:hypothetical protein
MVGRWAIWRGGRPPLRPLSQAPWGVAFQAQKTVMMEKTA